MKICNRTVAYTETMERDIFQAIADPNRRAILSLLAQRPLPLNRVADNFHISRQAVSKHIRILAESGLVLVRRQGRERYCEARMDRLEVISDWIERNRRLWQGRMDTLDEYLQEVQTQEKTRKRK